MNRIARLSARERSELFSETATQKGTTPAVVEKDFWVTWVHCSLTSDLEIRRSRATYGSKRQFSIPTRRTNRSILTKPQLIN